MTFPCFSLQMSLWGFHVAGVGTIETWRCEHPNQRHPASTGRMWDASPAERARKAVGVGGDDRLASWWGLPYVELANQRLIVVTNRKAS